MKINNKLIIALAMSLIIGNFAFAQNATHDLLVSATVVAGGTSTIVATTDQQDDSVVFNDGNNLALNANGFGEGNSRFLSSVVTVDYFVQAVNTAWDLNIYTDNPQNVLGLVEVDGNGDPIVPALPALPNTIPLKYYIIPSAVTTQIGEAQIADVNLWEGNSAVFSFVLDNDANPNSTLTSSSENGALGANSNFRFIFGTDISGAIAGSYATTVTLELAVQ